MMNPYRGEIGLVVNGENLPLRLSLGALAELEARLETESLMQLIRRFESGEFKTMDLIALLTAGLRGAGWQGDEKTLLASTIDGGPITAAQAAGQLLKLTFSLPE